MNLAVVDQSSLLAVPAWGEAPIITFHSNSKWPAAFLLSDSCFTLLGCRIRNHFADIQPLMGWGPPRSR